MLCKAGRNDERGQRLFGGDWSIIQRRGYLMAVVATVKAVCPSPALFGYMAVQWELFDQRLTL